MGTKKHCTFKSILTGKEVQFIIEHLFVKIEAKAPQGKMLGLIDDSRGNVNFGCPFLYSFGYAYYCDDQDFIKQYIEEHKDKFPELYEKIKDGLEPT